MDTYAYELNGSLYLNITNRCNNSCTFCIKYKNRNFEDKYSLWIDKEPSVENILNAIGDISAYKQIVFCGYGEPLIRLQTVIDVSKALKAKGASVRIDTDGQASLCHGRDITPLLEGLVDEIRISLNSPDAPSYQKLCRPVFEEKAFKAIVKFAEEAKKHVPSVSLTAVDLPGVDMQKCKDIADKIGVDFKMRPYYEKTYLSS